MGIDFSAARQEIINYSGNMTLTASPGSGKTTVLAAKISKLSQDESGFCGLVLSYTVKASKHIRDKCQYKGLATESCFFGTIDKFCISEIIYPFGNKTTKSRKAVSVIPFSEAVHLDIDGVEIHPHMPQDSLATVKCIAAILNAGYAIFENTAATALYILSTSKACKKYITSRYTHVFIDEYQDCSQEQHDIFMSLQALGLTCVAAGDPRQSIFKGGIFRKDPKYLVSLIRDERFRSFTLSTNFRSDQSIVIYADNFLAKIDTNPLAPSDCNVIYNRLEGAEDAAYHFINSEAHSDCFNLAGQSVGALFYKNEECIQASRMIHDSTLFVKHPIDEIHSPEPSLFNEILLSLMSAGDNSFGFAEKYATPNELSKFKMLRKLFDDMRANLAKPDQLLDLLCRTARVVLQTQISINTIDALKRSLELPSFLASFNSPLKGKISLMTYHKAKGLEFDTVFMTGINEGVFPYTYKLPQQKLQEEREQKSNLYYVGITRARSRLYLCSTSLRTAKTGYKFKSDVSPFVDHHSGNRYLISYENFIKNTNH